VAGGKAAGVKTSGQNGDRQHASPGPAAPMAEAAVTVTVGAAAAADRVLSARPSYPNPALNTTDSEPAPPASVRVVSFSTLRLRSITGVKRRTGGTSFPAESARPKRFKASCKCPDT
jgi:hypothetical protein